MNGVRIALFWSLTERYLLIVLALASNIILARLLTPEEIGIYSVSLAVLGFAQVIRDFGIGNFLIQERNLTADHIRTAFGVSLIFGVALFSAIALCAPLAAQFYAEPRILRTLLLSALNLLILPFCSISLALLRREMQFRRILYITLGSTALGLAVTMSLAFGGFGPDSMAIGSVVTNVATGFGAWLARPHRSVLTPSLRLWRSVLNFGGQSAFTNLVTTASMDANDLVVAKVLGFAPVALLSRAQGLAGLFQRDVMGAVRNVAMPAFAQLHRENAPLAPAFRKSVSILTVVAWPFYGFLAIYALEALRILYGAQWDSAAGLVPIFALLGACSAVNGLVPTALIAAGRIDLVTRLEIVVQPTRFAAIASCAVIFRSVEAVAMAALVSGAIFVPAFLFVANRGIPGIAGGVFSTLLPSLIVTVASLLPAVVHVGLEGFYRTSPLALWTLVPSIGLGLILAVITAELVKHPICSEPLYISVRKKILDRMMFNR